MSRVRIQALLQPARQLFTVEHGLRRLLDIVHVDPAPFALELAVFVNGNPGQADHALVVLPGFKLRRRAAKGLQLDLGLLGRVKLG